MNHFDQHSILIEGPITPNSLLEYAIELEELLVPQEPGTVSEHNYELKKLIREASDTAMIMEQNGVAEAAFAGRFATARVAETKRVRIKKGARRFSTHPQVPIDGEIVPRAYTVEIHDVYSGFVDPHRRDPRIVNGQVHWVGTGGYYFWADINDVELLT